MAGYVIHLAVAEEYLRKHKEKKENYEEFIEGVIMPDYMKMDKPISHYGEKSATTNLYEYLSKNELNTSYHRGYFLHLFTDFLFYNKCIPFFSKEIYNDYDLLNKEIMDKYQVVLPEKIKDQVFFKENETLVILSMTLMEKLIKDISERDLDEVAERVKANPETWREVL